MRVMADKCKTSIFDNISAVFRAILFVVIVFLHLPILMIIPRGRFSVKYMRFFMWTIGLPVGVRVRTHGALSKNRPLMCVANHISVFELFSIPIGYGCSFVGKIDIASYPLKTQIDYLIVFDENNCFLLQDFFLL